MKVGIIADVHDNIHNLILILEKLEESNCEKILFLGDFAGAAVAFVLRSSKIPIFGIWGNNDGDKTRITRLSMHPNSNLTMADDIFDFIEIDNRKIFLTHYPNLAKPMAKSKEFDAVFYGHNHLKNVEYIGDCLVANPGEIGAQKTGVPSYGIYDTKTNKIEIIILENGVILGTDKVREHMKEISFKWSQTKAHKY